ncbi:hypothetical protein Nepgr_005664 [Nepenthes gracilis]|uniref:Uncharacterized protein n=1 Tax=Nepenthes gracilis TaxID=150966 RepID=A0AAD3XGN3_NEPGR|nr:hypothetical protein Nepgr_005664 [Nepenthes gracilis]
MPGLAVVGPACLLGPFPRPRTPSSCRATFVVFPPAPFPGQAGFSALSSRPGHLAGEIRASWVVPTSGRRRPKDVL